MWTSIGLFFQEAWHFLCEHKGSVASGRKTMHSLHKLDVIHQAELDTATAEYWWFCFLFLFLLEFSCFTISCSFLLHSEVNQIYIYMQNSRFSLVIYFIHSSVHMSIPTPQFTPPTPLYCSWLTPFCMTISRSICLYKWPNFVPFYGWVVLLCIYVPLLLYSLFWTQTFRFFPCPSYCK